MSKIQEQNLIVLTGPTAVGKTEVALKLSQELNGVIISADSRQIYKELSIGTAKPSKEEIERGNMVLVDHISIDQHYSAGIFEREALEAITRVHNDGKLPILCGGTGLYLKAVCEGLDEFPDIPESFTQKIKKELKSGRIKYLKQEILEKDPDSFAKLDKYNLHRITRILSVIRSSGKAYSSILNQPKKPRNFQPTYLVMELPREELYSRINDRVLKMVEHGLIEEVRVLQHLRNKQALNTVGYSEVFNLLDGKITQEECTAEIQKNSRRYAKRQMTWFRNQMEAKHFSPSDYESIKTYIQESITVS